MGETRFRSLPLIRSALYHISTRVNELNIEGIANCLFALNRLSYRSQVRVKTENLA